MFTKKIILLLAVLFFFPISNYAWGEKGHTLVAEVAFKYLDKKTKKKILEYLDNASLKETANWMDFIKKDKKYDNLKPYHYVNFEKSETVTSHCCDNIIYQLNTTIADLKNLEKFSKEEVKTKLYFLFHLMGDLHQPLHVGYGSDKGGNDFQVQYNNKGTNLHSLFDSKIINAENLKLSQVLKVKKNYSKSDLEVLKNGDAVSWGIESRSYLDGIYTMNSRIITPEYADANLIIIKKQIYLAGLRLANVLQNSFGNK